jgi:hypothetical protein
LPDFLLALVVREAVAESFVQQEILYRDGELPVLGQFIGLFWCPPIHIGAVDEG